MPNTPPPRTLAEAVDRLLTELTAEELDDLAAHGEEDLIDYHFTLSARIRHAFGLFEPGSPLLADCERQTANGGWLHPDDASMAILCALWARLRH